VDAATDTPASLLLFHPATEPEHRVELGPYTADVATAAAPVEGRFPLVAVSHGTGSSPLLHRGLAAHLARHGFVVVMPEHARNHRGDDSLAGTATNLANRPRQVRQAIDAALTELGDFVVPDRIGVIGHSLGGYTALALAGGRPLTLAGETPDGRERRVDLEPDPRVKAIVLLAPAVPWYREPGALDAVRVPVLMLTAEQDEHTPPWHSDVVARGVRGPVEHRIVPGAGHYSFLTPFPATMSRPGFPPALDPPGFDRAAFHHHMYADVVTFLDRTLSRPGAPSTT
jgi:predicted dienelactone hydrolase